jgi:hypothetical protein
MIMYLCTTTSNILASLPIVEEIVPSDTKDSSPIQLNEPFPGTNASQVSTAGRGHDA